MHVTLLLLAVFMAEGAAKPAAPGSGKLAPAVAKEMTRRSGPHRKERLGGRDT
jgi:hypothetical protein